MIPTNARPFDPNNRPLKGEWIDFGESGDTAVANAIRPNSQQSAPQKSIDHGDTRAFEAVRRESKPFPYWIIVVAALAVGGIVWFALRNGSKPTAPEIKQGRKVGGTTKQATTTGSAPDGAPVLSLVDKSVSGNMVTITYGVNLNYKGAKLDAGKPAAVTVEGGEVLGVKLEKNALKIGVRRSGAGSVSQIKLNFAGDGNPNLPQFDPVSWPDPTPVATHQATTQSHAPSKTGTHTPKKPTTKPPVTPTQPKPKPSNGGVKPKGDG